MAGVPGAITRLVVGIVEMPEAVAMVPATRDSNRTRQGDRGVFNVANFLLHDTRDHEYEVNANLTPRRY